MITEIALRNFRGIISGRIELAPLTVLIGPNNSGKTSILEALLLSHGIREIFGDLYVHDLLLDLHRVLGSRSLKHLIYLYGTRGKKACVTYRVDNRLFSLLMKLSKNTLDFYVLENTDIDQAMRLEDGELRRSGLHASLGLDGGGSLGSRFLVNALFVRYDILEYAYRFLYSIWEELTDKGLTNRVAEWISSAIDEDYIDLTAEPFSGMPCIYLYRSDRARIRLGDLGDGVRMLVTMKLLVDYLDPRLILWDDIESHMNPRVLILLANWFADLVEKSKQVVVSTHSLEAAGILAGVVGDARIAKVYIEDGKLKVKYYTIDQIDELKKLGIDARI